MQTFVYFSRVKAISCVSGYSLKMFDCVCVAIGVYVEDMGDSSTQKLYAGLLGVGDEILEVNGEKVAGLSLDLVSQLMVQNGTASIRVLRHRPPHR